MWTQVHRGRCHVNMKAEVEATITSLEIICKPSEAWRDAWTRFFLRAFRQNQLTITLILVFQPPEVGDNNFWLLSHLVCNAWCGSLRKLTQMSTGISTVSRTVLLTPYSLLHC